MKTIRKEKKVPAQMTIKDLLTYVRDLEAENKRLEESFQKATGAVAADTLPTLAEMRKVSVMCRNSKCKKCIYFNTVEHCCRFDDGADHWDFGGVDSENN